MKNSVREPQQERSIEKKNKIIQAGYELFSEVGYYGTNTAEIAKKAGVSTGIVYGYFKDKRDILICVLEIYINNSFTPIMNTIDKLNAPVSFEQIIPSIIDEVICMHKTNCNIHEALHSLSGTDEMVCSQFIKMEDDLTHKISERLSLLGVKTDNLLEKVHFAMDIIQSFSHEYVFDNHDYINYDVMKSMVISSVVNLFT